MRPYPTHDLASWGILDVFLVVLMAGLYVVGCHNRVSVCPTPSNPGADTVGGRTGLTTPPDTTCRTARAATACAPERPSFNDNVVRQADRLASVLVAEGRIDWLSDAGMWPPPPVGSALRATELPFSTDCGRTTRSLS